MAQDVEKVLSDAAEAAGIPSEHIPMLLAQTSHESGNFKRLEESFNYSAERLHKVFPRSYPTVEAAKADVGNPEAIANKVYGKRLGNTGEGDGYNYRGRGYIQLTGKSNYAKYGKMIGEDLVAHPERAADPEVAAKLAAAYYKSQVADKGVGADDVTTATKRINGGSWGLKERKALYDKYKSKGDTSMAIPQRGSLGTAWDIFFGGSPGGPQTTAAPQQAVQQQQQGVVNAGPSRAAEMGYMMGALADVLGTGNPMLEKLGKYGVSMNKNVGTGQAARAAQEGAVQDPQQQQAAAPAAQNRANATGDANSMMSTIQQFLQERKLDGEFVQYLLEQHLKGGTNNA